VTDIAYLVPGRGLDAAELDRREGIANDLTAADVTVVDADDGPLSIESEVEHEWCVRSLLGLLREHEADYDAFVIGCFGDPGLAAAREFVDKPVVGPASTTFHTAAQLSDRFSCLTIRSTPASKRRQIFADGLGEQLASVRVVEQGVLEVDHESEEVVEKMVAEAENAVEADGAESVIPGCMSLAFMQVHDRVADDLGVPFLDPVRISLGTAAMWAEQGLNHSRVTYPAFSAEREASLFE
jgi:allantoin racemase